MAFVCASTLLTDRSKKGDDIREWANSKSSLQQFYSYCSKQLLPPLMYLLTCNSIRHYSLSLTTGYSVVSYLAEYYSIGQVYCQQQFLY